MAPPALRRSVKQAWLAILLAFFSAAAAAAPGVGQSLAEAARKEAERRQKLEREGVQEKKIEAADVARLAPGGAISTFSPGSGMKTASLPVPKSEPQGSLRSFQTRLQKLDRDIQQAEGQLKQLKARAASVRWAPVRTLKANKGPDPAAVQEQLRRQIEDLEGKLARLRLERGDTFFAGRKAGFLPGELENRGIVR
jgi:hypothetical protein